MTVEGLEDRTLLTTYVVDTPLDDPSAGAGLISLREAITAANTNLPFGDAPAGEGGGIVDQITFDESLMGQPIILGGVELTVTDHLSITGLGADKLTISGNNASGVFWIDAGVTVDISDLAIVDGSAADGGAIYNKAALTVNNCQFTNNTAVTDGGAIENLGTLTVNGSVFSDNWATYGGAIVNWSLLVAAPSLTINNSTFDGNYADWEGGVIWSDGLLDVAGSRFLNNSAARHGGGILNVGATVTITDTEFTGNSALGSGGTGGAFSSFIHLNGSDGLQITGSTFSKNSASSGGAIWNDMPANIADCTFSENTARGSGGAISHRFATMTITGSSLVDNASDRYGGAIDNWGATLKIADSTISGNSADWDGGAIENDHATLDLFNSTISGNSAGRYGGAIDNWVGTVNGTNSTIVLNRADAEGDGSGSGGGIYNLNAWSVTLLHNTLLAGNCLGTPDSDSANDLAGVDVDPASSHNLIGDANTSGGLIDGDQGNIVGNGGSGTIDITTVLAPNLADNGGPTVTHALVDGSPALDAGDNDKAVDEDGSPLAHDQRGDGFARIYGGTVDIGALEVQHLFAQIDVMPGSDLNPINLAQNGVIPVTILTTDSFDASSVNASTVVFAGAGAVHSALEDVDGDGDLDLILHFDIHETNLADVYAELVAGDPDGDGTLNSNHQTATVSLTGLTAADEFFEGFDEVDLFLSGKNLRDFLEELMAAGAS